MDDIELLIDLHKNSLRLGPGGDQQTSLAVTLSGLSERSNLKIADIGCGTGASTLLLAKELDAQITAIDLFPQFLNELKLKSDREGVSDRVTTLSTPMEELAFQDEEYDAIWSEGAIYNIGFAAGIEAWRQFLKPNGIIALTELTWLTEDRPEEIQNHWISEYPEVDTASAKLSILERSGFSPMGYFPLPDYCWLDNYYRPMQRRFSAFLERHGNCKAAQAIVAAESQEIELYEQYSAFVGYGYYVAQKINA